MMHCSRSSRWSRLKLLYLVPALVTCLWVSAKTEVYTTYLNGKLATQEELESIDPSTIEHVDVIHPQKKVFIETVSEQVNTDELKHEGRQEDVFFDNVEQMPQFPGGDAAFDQYVAHHVRYPKAAAENGVEGTIMVQFIVEADGRITHVQAIDSPSGEADTVVNAYGASDKQSSQAEDDEGRRALREATEELYRGMPPFEPGRKRGKPVRVQMTRAVNYRLQ